MKEFVFQVAVCLSEDMREVG